MIVQWSLGTTVLAATPASLADQWDGLLQKHVRKTGGVDYQGLQKDQTELAAFIDGHAALDVKSLNDRAKKAVYINLYNAGMAFNLLKYAAAEKIDVASAAFTALKINAIKVPGGNIWNGSYKLPLSGIQLTLDELEHGLIRGEKAPGPLAALKVSQLDPRIHAAVNCAALSCPRLRERAYRDENIEQLLDDNMREYLSTEAQFSKVDDDTLRANSIVYWYYDDFERYGKEAQKGGGAGTYLAHFVSDTAKDRDWKKKHLTANFNDRGKISLKLSSAFDFEYDWRINDVRNDP